MKYYEKTVASQELYKGRILTLRLDDVVLPNEQPSKREIVDHKNGVGILPIRGNHILFVKQYRKAVEKALVEIPAGLVEPGEDVREAATRELQEEIGLKPLDLHLIGDMLPSPGFCNEVTTLFMATQFVVEPRPQDDDEFIEIIEIPIRTVKALYKKGKFTDAKTACALGHFFLLFE